VTTGAENDLEHATALARQMVGLYGMSELIGLVHVGQKPNPFLSAAQDGPIQPDCSELTAREIDEEVKRLLAEAYESAKGILSAHRDQLDRVAQELLRRETLDEQAFKTLLEKPAPVTTIERPQVAADSASGASASENRKIVRMSETS
jgi:cell division protease FtsH